jgi:mono/diheme cytochrome c family protein
MKRWKKIAIVLLVLCIVAALAGWLCIRNGFSARAEPSALEVFVATRARALAIPSADRDRANPVANSAEAVNEGMEHFADHCAICHGNNGKGDTAFGKNLYPKAPDLRLTTTQDKNDGELYYTIYNGVRLTGMPAFGAPDQSDAKLTWRLVRFIRHLPELTAAEQKHMEALNPRSPSEVREEQEEDDFLRGDAPQNGEKENQH